MNTATVTVHYVDQQVGEKFHDVTDILYVTGALKLYRGPDYILIPLAHVRSAEVIWRT